jgi:radical SAM protein with 4Fe4S-binding SPASM domain
MREQYARLVDGARLSHSGSSTVLLNVFDSARAEPTKLDLLVLLHCQGMLTRDEIAKSLVGLLQCSPDRARDLLNAAARDYAAFLDWRDVATPRDRVLDPGDYFRSDEPISEADSRQCSLVEAEILVSERCNFDCAYCFRGGGRPAPDVAVDRWLPVIREMLDLGMVRVFLSGGEPTLHPGLPKMVRAVIDGGCFPYISTNGSTLSEQLVGELVDSGLTYLQISLDTVAPKLFAHLTRCGDLGSVVSGIKRVVAAGIPVHVKCVVSSVNVGHLGELIRFCEQSGVSSLSFDLFRPSCFSGSQEWLAVREPHLGRAKNLIEALRESGTSGMRITPFVETRRWAGPEDIVGCGLFRDMACIASNGDVIVCEQFDDPRLRPGNVFETSLRDILESEEIDRMKRLESLPVNDTCRACEYFSSCRTGCLSLSALYDGDPFTVDPRCWKRENVVAERLFTRDDSVEAAQASNVHAPKPES